MMPKNSYMSSPIALAVCVVMVLSIVTGISRAEMPREDVRRATETWVRYVTADARSDASVARMEPCDVDGVTHAYIAHLSDSGFCLCAADTLLLPVYLYSPSGSYDPDIPALECILDGIAKRQATIEPGIQTGDPSVMKYSSALSARGGIWRSLIAGVIPDRYQRNGNRSAPDSMELPLTSTWSQGSPYNDYTPVLHPGTDSHCVAGCGAIACAQVMYYWQWPDSGEGSRTGLYPRRYSPVWLEETLADSVHIDNHWLDGRCEWTSGGGGNLRMCCYWDVSIKEVANAVSEDPVYREALNNLYYVTMPEDYVDMPVEFFTAGYNWSLIQDQHSDPPDASDSAVALLCYHTGVAIHTRYGIRGSGAIGPDIIAELPAHLKYDPDCQNTSTAPDTIVADIQWLRPVILAGCSHWWVTYGYNLSTSQFLMNMGWGPNTAHVWYTLDSSDAWCSNVANHIHMIAPESVVGFVGNLVSGDGSPDSPYQDISEAASLAPDNATLIFKAGSLNTFATGELILDRPLTLKGHDATITSAGGGVTRE